MNTEALYPFPDAIFIAKKKVAKAFAHSLHARRAMPRTLVLWVDGSAESNTHFKPCSSALGYYDPVSKTWHEEVHICLSTSAESSSQEAELLAIREGFRKASSLIEHFDKLILFSDCTSILKAIREMNGYALKNLGYWEDVLADANAMFDQGIGVEMHWVPGKGSVGGMGSVDRHSREYRKRVCGVWPSGVILPQIIVPVRDGILKELPAMVRQRIADAEREGTLVKIQREKEEGKQDWRSQRARGLEIAKLIKEQMKKVMGKEERKEAEKKLRVMEQGARKMFKKAMRERRMAAQNEDRD